MPTESMVDFTIGTSDAQPDAMRHIPHGGNRL